MEIANDQPQNKSVLDVNVSYYNSCYDTECTNVNLLKLLKLNAYKEQVEQLRKIGSTAERNDAKKRLPAFTPSGLFSQREAAGLSQHSGLIQLDIDYKDNQHIANFSHLKEQLRNVPNIAYCGLSVSGLGYWCLVPVARPEKHKEHFLALQQFFKAHGINIDPACKDVCRLRFCSYDPEPYFNHSANFFYKTAAPAAPATPQAKKVFTPTGIDAKKVLGLIEEIENRRLDIAPGYQQWFELGCSLATSFGEGGREYFHRLSQLHPNYSIYHTDRQFHECLKHRYGFSLATFFHYCKQAGLTLPALQE